MNNLMIPGKGIRGILEGESVPDIFIPQLIELNAQGRFPFEKNIFPVSFPLILGWVLSGVIEEVGSGAIRFKEGDEVFTMPDPTRNGAYAEYIVVRESEVALKPKSLHHIRAAAIPLAALTAWHALFDTAELQRGQRVLIHGGAAESVT